MTIWDLIDKNINLVAIFLGAFLVIIILLLVIFILPKLSFIYRLYNEAKNENNATNFGKIYRKLLRKHKLVFASSTKDNDRSYKEIKDHFDKENKIVFIEQTSNDFDNEFDKFKIIVYKVHDNEFGRKCPIEDPLYKRISKYCSEQGKYCILVCKPGSQIEISEDSVEFNPSYITTVQFYSKLRETLYILLHFAP